MVFNRPISQILKVFVVIYQKPCGVCFQRLVWVVSTIDATSTPSFIKIQEVVQNSGRHLVLYSTKYKEINIII